MTYDSICSALGQCPSSLMVLETVDSTNTFLKELARQGAPHGTIVAAHQQTGGRGRLGRSFSSPPGLGLYLSVLWRIQAAPEQLMHLTCVAAEAARRAVQEAAGIDPQLKWINDLVVGKRKLCGILTELVSTDQGLAVVCGIGVNCKQEPKDFPPEIADMAVSIRQLGGKEDRSALAAALIRQLDAACEDLLTPAQWMADYRRHCMTLGQDVQLIRGDEVRLAHAEDITEQGALLVTLQNGAREAVFSGEVSVRGMYGYL